MIKRPLFLSLVIGLVLLGGLWTLKINDNRVFVSFLDVGQGDAILFRQGNFDVLVDGGPNLSVLQQLGKYRPAWDRKIDVLILTHPDQDHLGGLLYVANKYAVGAVMMPKVVEKTKNYRLFLQTIKEKNIPLVLADAGQEIKYANIQINILSPDKKLLGWGMTNINNASIVSRVLLPGYSLLLSGDAEAPAEIYLARKYGSGLMADVLKVGHHGSKTSASVTLLDLVKPKLAVISVAAKNLFGHPHAQTLKRLSGVKIERTDRQGTITLESNTKTREIKMRCEKECEL